MESSSSYPEYMNPLFTDMYQITMTYSYWKNKRHDEHAVFEAFFRKWPFKGNYAVFAGVDEVIEFLQAFKFSDQHISYLKTQFVRAEPEFFDWLQTLDANCLTITGIPDATIVYDKEPLLSIHGPLAVVQLIETPVLNFINFATLVCTNAARMKIRAGNNVKCIEFGLRRAQGPNGALTATKYSYMGGFQGTSNVYSGMVHGIPVSGTIAHSFIMSFDSEANLDNLHHLDGVDVKKRAFEIREELDWKDTSDTELYSFISYGCSYPDKFLCLIDTFSTLHSGCKNFIIVGLVLKELGYEPIGVRLDSGDLAQLSKDCKALWKEIGTKYNYDFSNLIVVASNDINEQSICELNDANHEIDVFGIGTNLVTCQAQPALGMVYKLVEIEGKPRIKLSEEKEKVLIPGCKKAFRIYENGLPSFDILFHESEENPQINEPLIGYHPFSADTIEVENPDKVDQLTQTIFDKGEIKLLSRTLHDKRDIVLKQLK